MKAAVLLGTATLIVISGALVAGAVGSPDHSPAPITRADLDRTAIGNVYDVINDLRHGWLAQGPAGGAVPTVYIEMPCTEVTCLRWLGSDQVEVVHFIDSNSNSPLWAPQHANAAIVVTLRTASTDPRPGVAGPQQGSRP